MLSAKLIKIPDSNVLVLHSYQKRANDVAHHQIYVVRLKLLLALGALGVILQVSVALDAVLAKDCIVALIAWDCSLETLAWDWDRSENERKLRWNIWLSGGIERCGLHPQ